MSLCVDKSGKAADVSPASGSGYWSQIMRCSGRIGKERGVPQLYRNGVAMLVLYEDSGLTLEEIGQAFGIHKGRVLRKIRQTRQALASILDGAVDGTEIAERLREARLSQGRTYTALSNAEWHAIERHVPAQHARQQRLLHNQRAVMNGVLWHVQTRRRWRDLPPEFSNEWTCGRLYRALRRSGAWDEIRRVLPGRDL